jgi:hypothetical protein
MFDPLSDAFLADERFSRFAIHLNAGRCRSVALHYQAVLWNCQTAHIYLGN